MVGAVLDCDDVVGVVGTEGCGAVQDGGFGTGDELGFDVRHPLQSRLAFDGFGQPRCRGSGKQRTAQFGLIVQQHYAGTGADGLAGSGQAGGAATNHQDVGVDVLLVVLGAVLLRVQFAQAVKQFGLKTIHQGDRGGGEHGLGHVAGETRLHLYQRVGFLHTGGHDAAGAVLVERVAGGDAAVGQQG